MVNSFNIAMFLNNSYTIPNYAITILFVKLLGTNFISVSYIALVLIYSANTHFALFR